MRTEYYSSINHQNAPMPLVYELNDADQLPEAKVFPENPDIIRYVFDHYHEALDRAPRALRYLRQERGLGDPDVITAFQIGFCDRTLGLRLPDVRSIEGGAIRGHLQRVGLLRPSGHELFRGALVFPVLDEQGSIVNAYGRKITPRLRTGTAYYVTLADEPVGLFNEAALACSDEIILCKTPLEAATFWCAKFRNVVATIGLRGFTDQHLEAFARNGVKRVYIAFGNTHIGDRAARLVAQSLLVNDTECRRVLFPTGMDANDFALANTSPSAAFAQLLRAAKPFSQSYDAIMRDRQCG